MNTQTMTSNPFQAKIIVVSATVVLAIAWLWLLWRLNIHPVWDEINSNNLAHQFHSMGSLIAALWWKAPLYRPVATSWLAVVLWLAPFDKAWLILRMANALFILLGAFYLVDFARKLASTRGDSISIALVPIFLALALFTPCSFIVATWYVNVFDALCLLFMAAGLRVLVSHRSTAAGFLFGVAWFCKESACFVIPIAGWLYFQYPEYRAGIKRALTVMLPIAVAYIVLRQHSLAFGSDADVHRFSTDQILPTARAFADRLWTQGPTQLPRYAGLVVFMLVPLLSRSRSVTALIAAIWTVATAAYLSMLDVDWHAAALLSNAVFVARLYYIPLLLILAVLAAQRHYLALLIGCASLISTTPALYQRYSQFQSAYQRVYAFGATQNAPVAVRVDPRSGVQATTLFKNIYFVDDNSAPWSMDPNSGIIAPNRGGPQ